VRCNRNARDISFRKNRIGGSLKSKVGKGFRVGRGGRSLRNRSALAERALGSRGFRPRGLQDKAKSPARPPSL
jgi:protoporphyrinogen oxidase